MSRKTRYRIVLSLGLALSGVVMGPLDRAVSHPPTPPATAMWAWHVRNYLAEPEQWEALIEFSLQEGITDVFLQVDAPRDSATNRNVIREPDTIRVFLRDAQAVGIRVHALDGDPRYAFRPGHDEVLGIVDAVLDYNEAVDREERFAGIRMDVEPYTTREWRRGDQAAVMKQWLEMNHKIAGRIRERDPDLPYGIDIPFWLDARDREGQFRFALNDHGVYQDLSSHFIDLADNIGIMAYRERALGPNGIIALSEDELRYASDTGGARIFIGVETLPPDPPGIPASITFGDRDRDFMDEEVAIVIEAARDYPAFAGMAIHDYESFRNLSGASRERENLTTRTKRHDGSSDQP